jgi:aryl-alcohol dehydrogenase-like predicted oxidoreductase
MRLVGDTSGDGAPSDPWTLGQGNHVLAIPGTGSLAHLAENVAAGALRLTKRNWLSSAP